MPENDSPSASSASPDQSSSAEEAALAQLQSLEGTLSDPELDLLESRLRLRAAVLGWTGDPLRQPATAVLADVLSILSERRT